MKFMKHTLWSAFTATFLLLSGTACKEDKPVQTPPVVETKPAIPAGPYKMPAEKADSNAKYLYLTFDDGPLPGSEAINQLVTENKFKASVFVVGKHTNNGRNSLRTLKDYEKNPYIDVCNHSYTHANNQYDKFYGRPDTALADIVKNEKELGLTLKTVRLPGRQLWSLPERDLNVKVSSAGKTAEMLKAQGFKIIGWDVEWASKGTKPKETPEDMVAKIEKLYKDDMTFTRNHLVVLAHDPMFSKPEGQAQLVKFVQLLREKNYVLENIRHYPEKDLADY
jgi:peptidoglycan-N-acetylglucosamine deacetylase